MLKIIKRNWRLAAVAILLCVVLLSLPMLPITNWLDQAGNWSRANPMASAVIFLAAFSIGPVLLIPGSVFAMIAGYLWGLSMGTFLASLGASLGAFAAFMNGRTLARNWAMRKMQGQPRLLALDEALQEQSFLVVLLTLRCGAGTRHIPLRLSSVSWPSLALDWNPNDPCLSRG